MNSSATDVFSLRQLFDSGQYLIPIYQRNYAWKEEQIVPLIQDLYDYAKEVKQQKYYLGTLVVYTKDDTTAIYETIDGQQRLTTLQILYAVLKNKYKIEFEKVIVDFEHRPLSSKALQLAFQGDFSRAEHYNQSIEEAYEIITRRLRILFGDNRDALEKFVNFLNNNATLVRVKVPKHTDLNHYFEIMNNRGVQLEKHEVLKATLLSYLTKIEEEQEREKATVLFNSIWEGCSVMDRYVQLAFSTDVRGQLFSNDWNVFQVLDFDELLKRFTTNNNSKPTTAEDIPAFSIKGDLLSQNLQRIENNDNETTDRFTSIIDFPNFLLHCLLLLRGAGHVSLDDKKLLDHFNFLKDQTDQERIDFVKKFGFLLLKLRFLFDQYVIKREQTSSKNAWSLQSLHSYIPNGKSATSVYKNTFGDEVAEQKALVFLQTMFHTAMPTLPYKYWLCATLTYLNKSYQYVHETYDNTKLDAKSYENFLKTLAKNFVFGRFLSENPLEYSDLLKQPDEELYKNRKVDFKKLGYHNIKNNLVFNYIDYLISQQPRHFGELIETKLEKFILDFEFSNRSSVEHFYPQHPKEGHPTLSNDVLHSIGNLSLISHSKNSSMNNYMPIAKREHYQNGTTADSIKQFVMFNQNADGSWNEEDIKQHEEAIIGLMNSNHKNYEHLYL